MQAECTSGAEASKDPTALAKDDLVRKWLALGAEMVAFAKDVKEMARQWCTELPREEGYPNSFLLLLTGFCYLRQMAGASQDCQHLAGPPSAAAFLCLGPQFLLQGWLGFLANDASRLR